MGTRYRQYKLDDKDAYEAEKIGYDKRLKRIPKAPGKKHRPDGYYGKAIS